MLKKNILFIFLFIVFNTFSQTALITSFPENNQLYKRDTATNKANVLIAGSVDQSTGCSSLTLKIFKNSILAETIVNNLVYDASGNVDFTFNYGIQAELSTYKFQLFANNTNLEAEADNIVAGDVYIVTGQSNSIRNRFVNAPFPYQSNFIRSYLLESNSWSTNPNPFIFGGIGYRFAENIVDNQQIPIALLNGGEGGKSISHFFRNDADNYDVDTNYGRLLTRYTNAGFVPGDVRALIWYQGEANGGGPGDLYASSFSSMYDDWEVDFTPEKYYAFQVHQGCGVNITSEIPEYFRTLPKTYPKISTISTNGALQGADNCHYYYTNGYEVLANRLYNLVTFDFYNSGINSGIYSPNIEHVRFSNISKTQIKFELSPETDTYSWENGIENDFILEGSPIAITNGYIEGNTVTLNLSGIVTTSSTKLTYLGRNKAEEPFIKNQNNIGMFSFKDIPIIETTNLPVSKTDGSWTYYYKNTDLINPIFAIEHTPVGSGANLSSFLLNYIDVTDLDDVISKTNISTKNGTFNLSKFWNVQTNIIPNGWVNIRFFYPTSLETELTNSANQFASNVNATVTSELMYIQTSQIFNPSSQVRSEGYSIVINKAGESINYGSYSGNNYLQINKIEFEGLITGGSVIKKVYTDRLLGVIRFNNDLKKFQGWNGVQWLNFN